MTSVTLRQADAIIDATLAKARELGLGKLAVAVLDPGGHVVALKREDGSEFLRNGLAIGKAYGALGMGHSSGMMHERADRLPALFDALSDMTGGRVVPVAGGVFIRDTDGAILGAVGVSGDTSERDEVVAIAGVEAAGLQADHGQNPEWRRP